MLASLRGGRKVVNWAIDLIQQAWQGGRVTNVVSGQFGANDLAADKVKTKVQLAPRAPFTLGFMLFFDPAALTKDLETGTVPCLAGDESRREGTTKWIAVLLSIMGLGRNASPLPRRDKVEKSGTTISTSSNLAMQRIKPCVWRSGCLKTKPSVRHISIARAE
tara:strand:+ start:57 stop:545 length:489 start_codon:yes stop_codon:yes gene_type:complete